MKKVSIVIPVYNAEHTLRRCVDSILAQTYTNLEIIAVNDESTDSTEEILKEYAEKDERFSFVTIEHGGVSKARNKGLSLATGEYLQFTDADDDLNERFFEKMISMMEREDAQLSVCRFNHPFFVSYAKNAVYDLSDPDDLLMLYGESFSMIVPWNKVWKRECFTVPFDEEVKFSEDELANLANLPNVKKAVSTDEYLYHYYFAPKDQEKEEKPEEKEESCINSIINAEAFWNNRTSIYFLGELLLEKRKKIISDAVKEGKFPAKYEKEMYYYRLLDYFFWQMPPYIGMGIPEKGLAIENFHIMQDPECIQGFKEMEVHGFKLYSFTEEELREKTARFTALCYKAAAEKGGDESFRLEAVFTMIFLKIFAYATGELSEINYYSALIAETEKNQTREAIYVNSITEA